MSSPLARRSIYLALFASVALGRATNVTRRDASEFQADSSIDVQALYNFVKGGSSNVLGSYGTCNECDKSYDVALHGHSDVMPGVISFMADMDIDCDGKNWQCPGNPDGQSQTTFGSADTYQMPWYVLPDEWYEAQGIVANNLGAVICDGKMFYAVFADSNGNTPQVIGETSLVLGNACYPDAGFSGANGHPDPDIAYIVFAGDAPDGVGPETLEYGPLKELGDRKVKELLAAIGGGSAPPASGGENEDPKPEPEEPSHKPEQPEQGEGESDSGDDSEGDQYPPEDTPEDGPADEEEDGDDEPEPQVCRNWRKNKYNKQAKRFTKRSNLRSRRRRLAQ